jgi:DNA helicase-2/ATP-dependent DNA helicase PcrA
MPRENIIEPFRTPSDLRIDYAGELNEQQHAAVTAPPGPSLVIAGAGSGKTRTLTYRVAWLLEQGIPPERILLLTFTNKAAKEMMRRVSELLGQDLPELWGGTFHSIGNRLLRKHATLLGYERDFTIMDRDDARHLLNACLTDSEIDSKVTDLPKADVLAEIFSLAANTGKSVQQILDEQYGDFAALAPPLTGLQLRYSERKRAANALDYDDLLLFWLRLLQEHKDIREIYQRRFQFILVDEYQDTNKLQNEIIELLAERHHNIMAVGDDAQSIYSWRGANFHNILNFPKRYPEAKLYKIETNYRSTPEILNVANSAIASNLQQFTKELTPARKPGSRPVLVVCEDSRQQAAFVAGRIMQLLQEGVHPNKIAVLYRSHFHALELQLELTRQRIPFDLTSGVRFYEQAHVKDATAYLRLVVNPRDEAAFKRLVQLFPGIGSKAAARLWDEFHFRIQNLEFRIADAGAFGAPALAGTPGQNQSVRKEESATPAEAGAPNLSVALALQACAEKVPKKAATAWAQFVATVAQLEDDGVRGDPSTMQRLVLEADYEEHLKKNFPNYKSRLEDLQQLAGFACQFESVESFLAELALLTNIETDDERPSQGDDDEIRLSTVHQAKGLEFDVVFVIMLCDGLFPSSQSLRNPQDEEEERRLMYVAITRARNELYLSYPLTRSNPATGEFIQKPSRFLSEIPAKLLDEAGFRRHL